MVIVAVTACFIDNRNIIGRVKMVLEVSCRLNNSNGGSTVNMVAATMTVGCRSAATNVKSV